MPIVAVDGNFKLDNIATRKPESDVSLSDGQAFLVGVERYQEHLKLTPEPKKVCSTHLIVTGRLIIILLIFNCELRLIMSAIQVCILLLLLLLLLLLTRPSEINLS